MLMTVKSLLVLSWQKKDFSVLTFLKFWINQFDFTIKKLFNFMCLLHFGTLTSTRRLFSTSPVVINSFYLKG